MGIIFTGQPVKWCLPLCLSHDKKQHEKTPAKLVSTGFAGACIL